MTDEPYRWLEAVANRREYIRDQLKGATPVFAFSRPEGILLLGVGTGQSKVFEVFDRHALAALGHPVDIERVRQTIIEAAHLEGFTRAAEDVTLRRLLNFSLNPLLKTSFEQIFTAPILVETIVAELGSTPAHDLLARVSFDGTHRLQTGGFLVAHTDPARENAATAWLREQLNDQQTLEAVTHLALSAWRALVDGGEIKSLPIGTAAPADKTVEAGLLDRRLTGRVRYRSWEFRERP
jgi:proteasome alpha subunit